MTDIIHANADRIQELFGQSEEYSVAAGDMRKQMNIKIANIRVQNEITMAAGIIRPLFRTLDMAEIVCKYADEFIKLAATTESSIDNLKIALAMMEPRNAIAHETRLLADRLRHKNE
jgi:hypothetical protein